ncbi:MAG TPA: hypothetical protein HPP87_11285 [Planctomycetes bacterium]|nr:hypothetical protein [Planctomycetota bacterium]HIJ71928.1 hypothetical protein [Planctomycetota bacterium]
MLHHYEFFKFVAVFFCLFALSGCDRSAEERDEALARVQQLRDELAALRTALDETQYEADKLKTNLTITSEELADALSGRDELKENLSMISNQLQDTRSKLSAALQTKSELDNQIAEMAKQQNTAIAMEQQDQTTIESLTRQLEERDVAISELERLNTELYGTVRELENYIEQIGGQTFENDQVYEEQYEEQVYDQNDI